MKRAIIATALLTIVLSLSAQYSETGFNPHFKLPSLGSEHSYSLFNPNQLSMSHSMGFSSGFMGDQSYYQSRYTTHLGYALSKNLDFKLDLNFVNDGTATMNGGFDIEGNDDNDSQILPNMSLEYRPFKNTVIRLDYRSYNENSSFGRYGYWRRY